MARADFGIVRRVREPDASARAGFPLADASGSRTHPPHDPEDRSKRYPRRRCTFVSFVVSPVCHRENPSCPTGIPRRTANVKSHR